MITSKPILHTNISYANANSNNNLRPKLQDGILTIRTRDKLHVQDKTRKGWASHRRTFTTCRVLTPGVRVGSAPLGRVPEDTRFPTVRSTKRPVVAQGHAAQSGGGGSYVIRMCRVGYAHSEIWQLAYRPPHANIARHRLSALERTGSERIESTICKRVNLGSPGPLFSTATQGSQSISCLSGWRCKGPSDGVGRRRLRGSAYRNTMRPSERSRAEAKDANGSHSELLSRKDEIGLLLRRTLACGTGGSRWGRKHLITPDDAWTSANPTCGASARLGDKGSPAEHRPTATA